MKNLTFKRVFWIWFILDLAILFINGATLKSWFLASIVHATLGIFLLIIPVYPVKFKYVYGELKAKKIIRIIAVLQIIVSFMVRINF